jgi:hypothetical protein
LDLLHNDKQLDFKFDILFECCKAA